MAKNGRKKIGIIFNFQGIWLGGAYYVQNIIKALNHLQEEDKPEIVIFYRKELLSFVDTIEYPFLEKIPWEFTSIYKGYIMSWLSRKNLFVNKIIKGYDLDGIYPLYEHPVKPNANNKTKIVAWFPDLQHKFYPNYFNKLNLLLRDFRVKMIVRNTNVLVVSSEDVGNHFRKFYKIPAKLKIQVLPFVSMIDDIKFKDFKELKKKFNLPEKYFMVSNQFYEHKNHITIFKALSLLKKDNVNVHVVFTGKMDDYRNPKFIENLKKEIKDNNLDVMISLLGVISRDEQLSLMKFSQAVIQPSLFEGWSTVIEDAKSLQVPVISSDIEVHKEQLGDLGVYFSSLDEKELCSILNSFDREKTNIYFEEYEERVLKFANSFTSIFN